GAGNVGVILSDLPNRREQVRRVFEDVFVPAARQTLSGTLPIPVVVAAPAPMSEYPMVDAALLVLQLAARECTSTDAGRLLRSPFVSGGHSERAQRALAARRPRAQRADTPCTRGSPTARRAARSLELVRDRALGRADRVR